MTINERPSGLNKTGWGQMILYYGCRQKKVDEIYKEEIDELVEQNVISSYLIAYTQEPLVKKVIFEKYVNIKYLKKKNFENFRLMFKI